MESMKRIFKALNQARVKYMLAGGIAVNLYGIERATADMDIIVLLEEKNLFRLVGMSVNLGLKPKSPVKISDIIDPEKRRAWIKEKNMKVFSLYDPRNPFIILDVLIEFPFDFSEVYNRRKKIRLEDTTISIVPLDVLIAMKKGTGRPQDRADVFYLSKIAGEWKDEK